MLVVLGHVPLCELRAVYLDTQAGGRFSDLHLSAEVAVGCQVVARTARLTLHITYCL